MNKTKNLKLPGAGLLGLAASPTTGKRVGTSSHSSKSGGSAGRFGRAMRDSQSADAPAAPPKKEKAKASAVARFENEGGRAKGVTASAGSTKRSPANKPLRGARDERDKKTFNANEDSVLPARGAKNGPRDAPHPGQNSLQRQKAESRVKSSRIEQAGLESRLLGHVSSSVKRAQARRDSKN